jgi:hypothetical protein
MLPSFTTLLLQIKIFEELSKSDCITGDYLNFHLVVGNGFFVFCGSLDTHKNYKYEYMKYN